MNNSEIIVRAYAKINLTLDITGKRPDGYHDLSSIMQSVSIADIVTLRQTDTGAVTLSCSDPRVPCDERNIAVKCARAFYNAAGIDCGGLDIHIEKNIPMQAGMGGGSADGAAVLNGLNKMYGKPLAQSELIELAAGIGADIPFCLIGGTAWAQGIGEKLTRLPDIPECSIVVVKPDIGISTAQAYSAVDNAKVKFTPSTNAALENLGDITSLAKSLHNDFEQALEIPQLRALTDELSKYSGCLGACMSGSGSAVFAMFSDEAAAEKCAAALRGKYPFVTVARPVGADNG